MKRKLKIKIQWAKAILLISIIAFSVFNIRAQAPNISYTPGNKSYSVNAAITPLSVSNSGGSVSPGGYVTTLVSTGFYMPKGICVDNSNNVYVGDFNNNQIKKVSPLGVVTLIAGSGSVGSADGYGAAATFKQPAGVALDPTNTYLYVTDQGNNKIRRITLSSGLVETFAGNGTAGSTDGGSPTFDNPTRITVTSNGDIYVTDQGTHRIRKVTPSGVASTIVGNTQSYQEGTTWTGSSPGTALFNNPAGISIDRYGTMYISDQSNQRIRKVQSGQTTTLSGTGQYIALWDANPSVPYVNGNGSSATFNYPMGNFVDNYGFLYVADIYNSTIRKISPDGYTYTIAGTPRNRGTQDGDGNSAKFDDPSTVALSNDQSTLFVCDAHRYAAGEGAIRKIALYGYRISPTLPAGLTFDTNNGTINGTPTVTSPLTTYTITATNASGSSSTTVNIQVGNPPVISYPTSLINNLFLGQEASTITCLNTGGTINSINISPSLPSGLTMNSVGAIYGTPTVESAFQTYTVTASNNDGSTSTNVQISVTNCNPWAGHCGGGDAIVTGNEGYLSNWMYRDGLWSDVSNWYRGVIPASSEDVYLKATATVDGYYSNNNLYIGSTGGVIIPAGSNGLVINHEIVNDNSNISSIQVKSEANKPNGSLIFKNSTDYPIPARIDMYSLAVKPRYQYFGIPLRSLTFSTSLTGSTVYKLYENDSPTHWLKLTSSDNLESFTGYAISQPSATTIHFDGLLENRDASFVLRRTTGASYPGFQLVGNPYTAAININPNNGTAPTFGSNLENTYALYNTGSYSEWNGTSSGSGTSPGQYLRFAANFAGTFSFPATVSSMQAFLVNVLTDGTGNENKVTIPYACTVVNNASSENFQRIKAVKPNELSATLIDIKGTYYSNKCLIGTVEGTSHNFDNGWDANYFTDAPNCPQIFIKENNAEYSTSAADDINNTFIGILGDSYGENYTLKFTHQNIEKEYSALYLTDLATGTVTDITPSETEYSFTDTCKITPHIRFMIKAEKIKTGTTSTQTDDFKAFFNKNYLCIDNNTNEEGDYAIFDLKGRSLYSGKIEVKNTLFKSYKLEHGAYILTAKIKNKKITQTIII